MSIQSQTIRPGLLVSLKTATRGGITYNVVPLESATRGAAKVARWETTRSIADAEEHARAVVARGRCRTVISRVCCPSSFGLLCPTESEEKLAEAIREAQAVAAAHNATARVTRVECLVITGRIADNDVMAARAIGAEVRDMLAAMEAGVRAADPEAIRKAANDARALSGMLSDDVRRSVSAAIAEVRGIARDIVKRAEKGAEQAAAVVEGVNLQALQAARFAVLDLSDDAVPTDADAGPVAAPDAPALDLMPAEECGPTMAAAVLTLPALDLAEDPEEVPAPTMAAPLPYELPAAFFGV